MGCDTETGTIGPHLLTLDLLTVTIDVWRIYMSPRQTQRTNGIMLRVNDAELRQFQKQAGYEPMAAWVRRILLEHCDRREKSQRKGG